MFAVQKLIATVIRIGASSVRKRSLSEALAKIADSGMRANADSHWNGLLYEVGVFAQFQSVDPETGKMRAGYRDVDIAVARTLLFWVRAMEQWDSIDVYASPRDLGWCGGAHARVRLTGSDVASVIGEVRAQRSRERPSLDRTKDGATYPLRVVDPRLVDALNRCADPEAVALLSDAELREPREGPGGIRPGCWAFWLEFVVLPNGKPAFIAHAFQRGADVCANSLDTDRGAQ